MILVVEDESDIRELISLHLRRNGYEVQMAQDAEQALTLMRQNNFDLAVLDWMLPSMSGLKICHSLRERGEQIPILMLTARADSADIIMALETGADDYITKPFEIPVLLARIQALLRRSKFLRESHKPEQYTIGGLSVDLASHTVTYQTKEINLTVSEFKLLVALLENQGRALSRATLIGLVQGEGITVTDRTIDTHIFGLRKNLGTCADVIETIRGVGYRIKPQ